MQMILNLILAIDLKYAYEIVFLLGTVSIEDPKLNERRTRHGRLNITPAHLKETTFNRDELKKV